MNFKSACLLFIINCLIVISGLACCGTKSSERVEGLIEDFMGIDVNDGDDVRRWILTAQETGNKDAEEALLETRDVYQQHYERAGDQALQEGRPSDAIALYQQAVTYTDKFWGQSRVEAFLPEAMRPPPDIDKRNADLYSKLGNAYTDQAQLLENNKGSDVDVRRHRDRAVANYIKAAEASRENKDKAWFYARAALSGRMAGDAGGALDLIDKAIELNPQETSYSNMRTAIQGGT